MQWTDKMAAALSSRLKTLNMPTQWENDRPFSPPASAVYLRESFLPGQTFPFGIFQGDVCRGIYQVDVMSPKGSTKGGYSSAVDAVCSLFPRGLRLSFDAQSVTVLNTWRGPGFETGDRYAVPISVSFWGSA